MTWRSHVSRPLNYWRFSNSFGNGHRGIRFALTVADMSMFSMDNRLRRASSQWVDNGFGQASEFLTVIYTKLWCRQNMTRIQGMRTVSERPCSAYVCNVKHLRITKGRDRLQFSHSLWKQQQKTVTCDIHDQTALTTAKISTELQLWLLAGFFSTRIPRIFAQGDKITHFMADDA